VEWGLPQGADSLRVGVRRVRGRGAAGAMVARLFRRNAAAEGVPVGAGSKDERVPPVPVRWGADEARLRC